MWIQNVVKGLSFSPLQHGSGSTMNVKILQNKYTVPELKAKISCDQLRILSFIRYPRKTTSSTSRGLKSARLINLREMFDEFKLKQEHRIDLLNNTINSMDKQTEEVEKSV